MEPTPTRPHIIVEGNIPFSRGLLDAVARVSYLPYTEITREAMRDADALVTRTRTRCDAMLLEGSRCSIIASATIGLDHVDAAYCASRGIIVANAPGCNAPAVAQYVMASLLHTLGAERLSGLTIGVVGVGHVGSIVARWARQLGMRVMLCDPPRQETGDYDDAAEGFSTLHEVARHADVITFHTPLTHDGAHKTFHMADEAFFNSLQRKPVIINSARGPIVDTPALLDAMSRGLVGEVFIDCWEGEPTALSAQLLDEATVATPHIAGYSYEGKVRATSMAMSAVARHFGLPEPVMPVVVAPGAAEHVTAADIAASYNPAADTEALKRSPADFEALRNNYNLRHEVPEANLKG